MKLETKVGETITAGKYRITPVAKTFWAGAGSVPAGIVWNRASAVLVEAEGRVYELPVRDATRRAQLLLFGIALASWIVLRLARRRRS